MDLDGDALAALLVQDLEAVHKGDGDDGALGLHGGPEAAAVEFAHHVAVFAAGALGEDQVAPALLYLLGDGPDHLQGLAYVLPVHGEGFGALPDLPEQRDVSQLLFQYSTQWGVAGGGDGYHIEKSLVVAVHHKTGAGGGDVLQTVNLQVHIAGFHSQLQNVLDMVPFFLFRVLVGVFGVVAELAVKAGNTRDVPQHHECESVQRNILPVAVFSILPQKSLYG